MVSSNARLEHFFLSWCVCAHQEIYHHHLSRQCLGGTQVFSDSTPLASVDSCLAGLLPTLPSPLLAPFLFSHSTPLGLPTILLPIGSPVNASLGSSLGCILS